MSDLLGADDFRISMTLTAEGTYSAGEVARLHGSFILSADAKGEVGLRAFTTDGTQIRLTTSGAGLKDLASHDIDISLDKGVLAIAVDGHVRASGGMSTTLASTGNHDLIFGNPWSQANFAGTLSSFGMFVNEDDFAAAALSNSLLPVPQPLSGPTALSGADADTFAFATQGLSGSDLHLLPEIQPLQADPGTLAQPADHDPDAFADLFGVHLPLNGSGSAYDTL